MAAAKNAKNYWKKQGKGVEEWRLSRGQGVTVRVFNPQLRPGKKR